MFSCFQAIRLQLDDRTPPQKLKLSSCASVSNSHLIPSSFILPSNFKTVVGNDLNAFRNFPFLWWRTLFLQVKKRTPVQHGVMYVYECTWIRGMDRLFRVPLTRNGCTENMWLQAVKQGAPAPGALINNRRGKLLPRLTPGELKSAAAEPNTVSCLGSAQH